MNKKEADRITDGRICEFNNWDEEELKTMISREGLSLCEAESVNLVKKAMKFGAAKGYLKAIEKAKRPIKAAIDYVEKVIKPRLENGTRGNSLSREYLSLIEELANWEKEK